MIKKKKISELAETTNPNGLYFPATDGNPPTKKILYSNLVKPVKDAKLDKQTDQNTVYAVDTSGGQTNIPIGQLQITGGSIARRTNSGTLLVSDAINGSDAVNLQTMKGYAGNNLVYKNADNNALYIYSGVGYFEVKPDATELGYDPYAIGVTDNGLPYFYDIYERRPLVYSGTPLTTTLNGPLIANGGIDVPNNGHVSGNLSVDAGLIVSDIDASGKWINFWNETVFNNGAEIWGTTTFHDYVNFGYPATFGNGVTFGDTVIINAQLHVGSNSFFNNPAFFQTDTYFNDDAILASGVKILGTRSLDGAQEVLIELGEYGSYEQTEVGSEARPLCLNHNSVGSDGTAVGKNILVNYKNGSGAQQVDAVAYLSDVRFLSEFPLNQEVNIRGNIYAKRVTFSQATPVVTISPVVLVAGAIALLKVEGTMQDNPFSGYYSVSPDSAIMKFTAGTGITLSLNWSSGSVISYDILIYYTK